MECMQKVAQPLYIHLAIVNDMSCRLITVFVLQYGPVARFTCMSAQCVCVCVCVWVYRLVSWEQEVATKVTDLERQTEDLQNMQARLLPLTDLCTYVHVCMLVNSSLRPSV